MPNTSTINSTETSQYLSSSENRIILFDLVTGGHHPTYIRHLIEYWCENKLPGSLDIVVSPKFLEVHQDVVCIPQQYEQNKITFIPISTSEIEYLESQSKNINKFFFEWNIFCKYAKKQQSNQAVLMYFDHLQLPIVFGSKSPCPIGGIYFRPTFHYDTFSELRLTIKEVVRQWRQKALLFMSMQNSQLNYLYCLDRFSIEHVRKLNKKVQVFPLADPVDNHHNDIRKQEAIKSNLKIDSNKEVFLLFGVIDNRKGIYPLLDSIELLPINVVQKICLLIAGPIPEVEKEEIESRVALILQKSQIQIILHNQYIPSKEVCNYFELADFVLVPYQKHVGMSNVIVHAAAAKKPVLTSNYGLIGKIVNEYKLGVTFDSTSPAEIAQNIQKACDSSIFNVCDIKAMQNFAVENSGKIFAQQILESICISS